MTEGRYQGRGRARPSLHLPCSTLFRLETIATQFLLRTYFEYRLYSSLSAFWITRSAISHAKRDYSFAWISLLHTILFILMQISVTYFIILTNGYCTYYCNSSSFPGRPVLHKLVSVWSIQSSESTNRSQQSCTFSLSVLLGRITKYKEHRKQYERKYSVRPHNLLEQRESA